MPSRTLEVDGVFHDVVSDERMSATSYDPSYPPQEARLSGAGWCADSVCNTEPTRQYLTIDYGIEVVLQAIAINATSRGFYVTQYMIEYAGSDQVFACVIDLVSNSTVFSGVDICRRRTDPDVRSFKYPVIARYVRIIPLSWEGPSPCLTVELYGCPVLECMRNRIRPVSDNDNLIDGIQYSSIETVVGEGTITGGWCGRSRDENPNFNITFSEPVHLLYAVASGVENLYYPTEFSYHYENLTSNRIDYFNVDGENIFGLEDDEEETFLLWRPITTARLQLVIHEHVYLFPCIEIHFYGCTIREVINHAVSTTDATITPTTSPPTCGADLTPSSVLVVTTTITVTPSTVVVTSLVPESSCSCSDQQQSSSSSSSSDSDDVVTICVPVVVVVGIIILSVLVIVGGVVWWKTNRKSESVQKFDKIVYNPSALVENDLYGLEPTLAGSGNTANLVLDEKKAVDTSIKEETVRYDVPQDSQPPVTPPVTYETVEEPSGNQDSAPEATSSIYEEIPNKAHDGIKNPSYDAS